MFRTRIPNKPKHPYIIVIVKSLIYTVKTLKTKLNMNVD